MTTDDKPAVRVLGRLELLDPTGCAVPLAGRRLRRLVAVLVVHRGRNIRTETLVETVFADAPPRHPAAALHSLAARLRRTVGADLTSADGGYALHARTDAAAFEAALAVDDHTARDTARALGRALDLWRGTAYAEFLDLPILAAESSRLELRRLDAVERRAETLLVIGHAADAVGELEALLAEHPFRERAHAALMRALYATGCHNDALRHYTAYRRYLTTELGLEPAPALRQLHHDILRHDIAWTADRLAV